MVGTYVSNNEQPILEGPSGIDTLKLFSDGSYESGWSEGKWTIDNGQLSLSYFYTYGTAGFHAAIERPFFLGTPRIYLNRDLRYYYKKIK